MTRHEEEQLMKIVPRLFDIMTEVGALKGENESLKKENEFLKNLVEDKIKK